MVAEPQLAADTWVEQKPARAEHTPAEHTPAWAAHSSEHNLE